MQQFFFLKLEISGYVLNPLCGGWDCFYGNVASWRPSLHNSYNRWM